MYSKVFAEGELPGELPGGRARKMIFEKRPWSLELSPVL